MLTIFIKLTENIEDKFLFITPKNNTKILKSKTQKKTFYSYPIKTKINYFTTIIDSLVTGASRVATVAINGVIITLFAASFNSAVTLIKIMQMLEFFVFLNVDLPLNVLTLIEFFSLEIFDIVPNPLEVD